MAARTLVGQMSKSIRCPFVRQTQIKGVDVEALPHLAQQFGDQCPFLKFSNSDQQLQFTRRKIQTKTNKNKNKNKTTIN